MGALAKKKQPKNKTKCWSKDINVCTEEYLSKSLGKWWDEGTF